MFYIKRRHTRLFTSLSPEVQQVFFVGMERSQAAPRKIFGFDRRELVGIAQ
jgi:hypothetical protein